MSAKPRRAAPGPRLDRLARLANKFLRELKIQGGILDIFLLPNAEMKAIKKRMFRGKVRFSEPNVVSFPEPEHFPHPELRRGKKYLGEIYLNKDIIKKSPERAAPLLLHGILHLLGHDHKKKNEAQRMEKLERKILGRF